MSQSNKEKFLRKVEIIQNQKGKFLRNIRKYHRRVAKCQVIRKKFLRKIEMVQSNQE